MEIGDIKEYIPQREPFIFVDEIKAVYEDYIITNFKIKKDTPFCVDGVFQEAGIIENIAQTAAALEGCIAVDSNKPVKRGMIGAVKNLEINFEVNQGDTLRTSVYADDEVMGVKIVSGQVVVGNKLIAKCDLQIFLED